MVAHPFGEDRTRLTGPLVLLSFDRRSSSKRVGLAGLATMICGDMRSPIFDQPYRLFSSRRSKRVMAMKRRGA
jgi:hypothetical protein